MIDVREFLKVHTVEDLNRSADEYFAAIKDWTELLAKPFAAPEDCAKLLIEFWAALVGSTICPGMKVLDFGPGSCWTSHFLTQMGCKVYACDISPSALNIGKARYQMHPPFGNQPAAEFLVYDGFRFPLDDGSVDRVLCMHSLHHVPNLGDVIGEMARVLTDFGIAAFVEPGPDHSKGPASQRELDNGVLENDIIIEDIWNCASAAGFRRLELTAFPIERVAFSLQDYKRFIAGRSDLDEMVVAPIRKHAQGTRTFFLYKDPTPIPWSTASHDLAAKLELKISTRHVSSGEAIRGEATVQNTGRAAWVQSGDQPGSVRLGVHLKNLDTGEYLHDYGRIPLGSSNRPIWPGEDVSLEFRVPSPTPGTYEFTFDLVSERVCWFSEQGRANAVIVRLAVS